MDLNIRPDEDSCLDQRGERREPVVKIPLDLAHTFTRKCELLHADIRHEILKLLRS